MSRSVERKRDTRETQIHMRLELPSPGDSPLSNEPSISTGLPFFDHMLTAMAFHGGFELAVDAKGDLSVDPHHVVEDTGIVLGACLDELVRTGGPVKRFGHAVVPMDEALSEATIDVCGRATLAYRAEFPQQYSGTFAMWLFREFFSGLSMGARIALHLECRYGENAHHMIEALFKALGKTIGLAYASAGGGDVGAAMSTKGIL